MGLIPARFSLRDLLLAILVLSLIPTLGLPMLLSRRLESRRVACASNLRTLWSARFSPARNGDRRSSRLPRKYGEEFWLRLQGEPATLEKYDAFYCPFTADIVKPGETSYRGPRMNVNRYADEDVVGADKEGNHGPGAGGNLLFKRGDGLGARLNDPMWALARRMTRE